MIKDFVKGSTSDEKFASINQTFKHFSRRLHKTIVGVMPPSPIFNYVEEVPEDGILLRCILPGHGRIIRGCLCVEEYLDDKTVSFVAEVHGSSGMVSHVFDTRKKLLLVEPNLSVAAGDRLVLRTEVPPRVRRVWSGFLFEFEIRDMAKEHYLIDQFESLVKGEEDASKDQEG